MPKRKKGTKPAVANKKKLKQEVNPTSLPPPTPPTPPTPAVFPTEIFALILSNFRSDPDEPISYRSKWQEDPNKDVLAKCMRVSTSFNALAVPLLYEVMDWEDMKQDPLQIVNEGKALRGRSAQWLTMNTETRHIRMVNFRPHDREGCCKTGKLLRQRPIKIPVFKFKLSEFHKESGRNLNYGECFDCPIMLDFAPKKVVVTSDGNYDISRPTYSRSAAVEELVLSVNLRQSDRRYFYPSLNGQAKRLVIILSLANYAAILGSTRLSPDDCLTRDMTNLAERVAWSTLSRNSASEIMMVDFDASNQELLGNAKACFEPALQRVMKEGIRWLECLGPSDKSYYKSSAEFALVTPKFITMREYLTNHDWEGVYTKTEVEKMLKEDVEE